MNLRKTLAATAALLLGATISAVPATAATGDDVLINELLVSTAGADSEYLELIGTPGFSLDGLSFIEIEADVGNSQYGSIDTQIDFDSSDAIGDNGFFLVTNATAESTYGVTGNKAHPDSFENSSATYLLVPTASLANGLPTESDVLDSVHLTDGDNDPALLGAPSVGPAGNFLPPGAVRVVDGVDTDTSGDWGLLDFNNSTAINTPTAGTGDEPPPPPPAVVFIHEVQGSGSDSPLDGQQVTVEAVVIGDFQAGDQLRGFFIQEEDLQVDGDLNTSEGVFVFCGSCATDVVEGDLVTVTGEADEFFNMTQINASNGTVDVVSLDNELPSASAISLPIAGDADAFYEAREGMRVTYTNTLVVSEYFAIARFGQIVLYPGTERPYQYSQLDSSPTAAEYAAFQAELDRNRVILDDDDNFQNSPLPDGVVYHPQPGGFSTGTQGVNYFRGGDTVASLTGVLHWSFPGSGANTWRIRPTEATPAVFTPVNTRPGVPEVGGSFTVGSLNVLNYFSTVDNGPDVCGPAFDQDCRGADSEAERVRQLDKIVAALEEMDADVIGLIELENNASQSLADIAEALPGYAYVDTGTVGTDAIKVGFIYNTETTDLVGDFAILDSSVDPTFNDDKNRPVVAQTFLDPSTGGQLTVAVNHLKSKGSDCDDLGDPDLNDGQANCNLTRTSAATAMVNWLAADPTGANDTDALIIGDLNSYAGEDPIRAITDGGYTDLLQSLQGPSAYTYLFDGQLGTLDYALSNGSLTPQVTGTAAWNINADEVPLFDYNDAIQDSGEASFEAEPSGNPLYEANAYRSSDHDPVLVGLSLDPSNLLCNGLVPTIVGTPGDDVIVGTNKADVIMGLGGDDVINGLNGKDVICGGPGDDEIDGGNGTDLILGGRGNDTISGGNAGDDIRGGSGDDTLYGNNGNDAIDGGAGTDTCDGGLGNNTSVNCEA
ncbi:MAG: ExeM/NucH family extracellular endonuclease [Acidimicrobiales bacterium]|nr:ExeM/NucH family extracellular endonuclease [Acidimicrobiales bacterium]